ncbi:TonB-dependent receptor [Rhodohalobacter halophilus]|uniref:hypothetical protein n=1 Tax=Rhodohalobacter halophilus TaxID=1812810 RepID=UPI00114D049C|nr:hypothetical protein [Rhodohalobacter halophilus]
MNRLFVTALSVLFTFGVAGIVYGQDAQQSEAQQTLLPEIDPQDIEIRSQFQARFPGLRRQPILGFNPRPRVFQIDPNRTPFFEDEETVVANLPVGVLERPEAPQYTPLGYTDPKNGFARLGIGSYISPEADIYAIGKINNRNRVAAQINHFSTDGHLDNFTDSRRSSEIGLNSIHRASQKTTLRTNLSVNSGFNHYPGLYTVDGEPASGNDRVERLGIKGGFNVDWAQTSLSGVQFSLHGGSNQFDLSSDFPELQTDDVSEWNASSSVQYSRLGDNIQEVHRLKINTSFGGVNDYLGENQSWSVTTASAHYERLFNYQTDVKASLGISGATDAVNDFSLYLSPEVTVTHTLFSGVDLKGHLSGTPSYRQWGSIHNENSYVSFSDSLQHQFEWLAFAEAQIEPISGTTFSGGISYQNIKNYQFYNRNTTSLVDSPGTDAHLFGVNYHDANMFKIYGSFAQDIRPDVFWVSADGSWQRARLSNEGKIPFIESLNIKGTVALRPFKQLVLQGWGEYVGGRDDSDGNSLSSFMLLGGSFEISLAERLGVYGKLVNLLGEEYELWQGYPERGFQGYIGITYLF